MQTDASAPRMVTLPRYFIEQIYRHYRDLARVNVPQTDTRAVNAKRVSRRELTRLRAIIDRQTRNE